MDLRQISTFLQVAELGSLSKAAERLRIAQPALSRQMRLLEQELGVALFTRHGRGMLLTPPGERLRARAGAILREIDDTRAELTAEAGAVRGRVVVGMPPTVGGVVATRLVERFLDLYPEVTLRVVLAFSGFLLEWLHGGEADLAVVYGTTPPVGVRLSPLLVEPLGFVTRAAAGPAPHHAISFAEAARARLILPGPQHGLRRLVEAAARDAGLSLCVAVEADDLHIQKDLVRRGRGATILPPAAVHAEVAAGALAAAPIVDPPLTRKLMLAEPLGRRPSNAALRCAAVLREEIAAMVAAGLWQGQLLDGKTIPA